MEAPTMPVRAIKNILAKEVHEMYTLGTILIEKAATSCAVQSMFEIGKSRVIKLINEASDYQDLDSIINTVYRMSLVDWIESL